MSKLTDDGREAEDGKSMADEQKNKKGHRWGVCECCGFETWIRGYDAEPPDEGVNEFCDVCSSTFISNIYKHLGSYGVDVALYLSLGHIANMILVGQRKQAKAQERWNRVVRALSHLYEAYYKRPTQVWDLTEEYLGIRDALKELMETCDDWLN